MPKEISESTPKKIITKILAAAGLKKKLVSTADEKDTATKDVE